MPPTPRTLLSICSSRTCAREAVCLRYRAARVCLVRRIRGDIFCLWPCSFMQPFKWGCSPDHIASGFSLDTTPSWIAHFRCWTGCSSRQTCWTRSDIRWTASAVIRLDMRWDLASPLEMVYRTRKPPSQRCHSLHCTAKVSTCQISRVLHVYRRLLSYLSVGVDVFALAKMNTRPVAGRPVLRDRLDSL